MNNRASGTSFLVTIALWGGLVLAAPLSPETQDADSSFQLSARQSDIPGYFPGYLGNGYVSTLTAPKGTETSRAYLVALMDYTAGDVSRPAAVPGWTDIDFRAGDQGFTWLNRAPWREGEFSDYRQTLDMHAGTLTTSYRFKDHNRETAIRVETLLSQAFPHLGATRLRVTPDYDGVVQLSFAFTLWSQHTPRFPIAQMSGLEMEQAVTASGQSFEARPPAAADREAVWYPGYVQIRGADGDPNTRSLWLNGRAAEGKSMAMAGAIALPDDAQIQSVAVGRNAYRLSLDVSIKVERGHTYDFSKFVAFSREGWGDDAAADLQLARQARDQGFEHQLTEQRAAWSKLWQSDIEVEGDAQAQQVVHSELYQLLAAATPDTGWGLGACATTPGYSDHIFWDSDTWVFPALLLLYPERAKSLVTFRERTLDVAQERARQHGFAGAMYPWEADPDNGSEQTPHSAFVLSESEIHVTAEIAIAQWQYYLATQDRDWLRQHGWPVIRAVARFWVSRATYDAAGHRYQLEHVNSVAESQSDVRNDTFTNLSARKALQIATAAASASGDKADPLWERIARELYIPIDERAHHHLPFDPSIEAQSKDFGSGPLALLFLPALDLQMDPQLRQGNYDFAVRPASLARVGSFSMGLAPHVIAAAVIGNEAEATRWLDANYSGGTLKPPFHVRTETAGNNTGYFITGSAGYLQSLLYGFSGLRLREQGLVEAYPPVLPSNWRALTLRNVQFRGKHLDVRIERDASGKVHLARTPH
jgi:protein-glucosylgalactosylhydroxylysine glucosidase